MGPEKYIKEAFEGQATETNGEALARTEEKAERIGQHISNAQWMVENAATPEEKAKAEANLAALQAQAESTDEQIGTLAESDPAAIADSDVEVEDDVPTAVSDKAVIEEENVPTEVKTDEKTEEQPLIEYTDPVSGQKSMLTAEQVQQRNEDYKDLIAR